MVRGRDARGRGGVRPTASSVRRWPAAIIAVGGPGAAGAAQRVGVEAGQIGAELARCGRGELDQLVAEPRVDAGTPPESSSPVAPWRGAQSMTS